MGRDLKIGICVMWSARTDSLSSWSKNFLTSEKNLSTWPCLKKAEVCCHRSKHWELRFCTSAAKFGKKGVDRCHRSLQNTCSFDEHNFPISAGSKKYPFIPCRYLLPMTFPKLHHVYLKRMIASSISCFENFRYVSGASSIGISFPNTKPGLALPSSISFFSAGAMFKGCTTPAFRESPFPNIVAKGISRMLLFVFGVGAPNRNWSA